MENKVTLTMKELHKLKMIIEYEAGKVHAQKAAELLGISKRQFRRLVAAYRKGGMPALAHGNRGRVPANRLSEQMRQEILRLAKETYQDYNDCHFTEELAEQVPPIVVSRSTLRRIRAREPQEAASSCLSQPPGALCSGGDAVTNGWKPSRLVGRPWTLADFAGHDRGCQQ